MKIVIIGAGITGLSAAKLLSAAHEVEILEKKNICGGIARTKDVNGIAYHVVGGHCFNSKYPDVLDFVFSKVLPKEKWHLVQRKSKINFGNEEISYPVEFAVKEIYKFDKELAEKITVDFLSAVDDGKYANLDEWFRKKFGNTLAEKYFIPYNSKIWNKQPINMSSEWVQDKLPIPDKKSFFESLMTEAKDNMSHASFYYPDTNNQNTFIDALADGLNIQYNYAVQNIKLNQKTGKWIINNEIECDKIINTSPIDILPSLIENTPAYVIEASKKLKYNSISTVFCTSKPTEKTWTYLPEKHIFHRFIHIGSFHKPADNYTICEVVGKYSQDELFEESRKDEFIIEPIDYNVSEHAYVVFDENYNECTSTVISYLNSIGIETIGRFGEWQYYNMDVCMKRSIDLIKKFL